MARIDTLPHFLTDVADAIREKTGSSETIQASNFDTEISSISGGGDLDWKSLGFDGTPSGIQKMYNDAKKIQDDWDPTITSMASMYSGNTTLTLFPTVDTSNVTSLYGTFTSCTKLIEIAPINTSRVKTMGSAFQNCTSLITLPQLDASSMNDFAKDFYGLDNLENFGGLLNVGQAYSTTTSASYRWYALDFTYAPKLTHDSLMNIINGLYDIAAKGCQTQSLVLGSTNLAKLTQEEIAIATNKGWNVT